MSYGPASGKVLRIYQKRLAEIEEKVRISRYVYCAALTFVGGGAPEPKPFTAFAMLMDRLMDTSKDVAVLGELGIIDKRFGSDEKIVSFFKDLCTGIFLEPRDNYLQVPVSDYVTSYYQKDYLVKFYLWRNRLIPDYFSNPWAVPSMIAALIALALSLVSTLYTIYPYYHPRS